MKINNRQQLLIIVTMVAAAVFIGDRLILSPLISVWHGRNAEIKDLKDRIRDGNLLVNREHIVRERWEGMQTNTLPSQISAAENKVLKAFENWSQDSQVSLTSIRPEWKRNADEFMTLDCHVDAAGNLSAMSRFLYDVEQGPLALKVESVELSGRDNDGQQLVLGLQISGLLLNPQER
ncbi:MAG: hypothetical protein JWR19_3159 [Pedosphaera sp.]|nr:hypothetical protein [Pedosphaera sp.]